jgi:hypothetical protein
MRLIEHMGEVARKLTELKENGTVKPLHHTVRKATNTIAGWLKFPTAVYLFLYFTVPYTLMKAYLYW